MSTAATSALRGPGKLYNLHPGDVVCAGRGDRLQTLLGSCVAVVLTDPRRTTGVMCHYVHSNPGVAGACHSSAHADVALEEMHALLRSRGINPMLCEAYAFGGGNMFPNLMRTPHVGEGNSRWVVDALTRVGVKLLAHDFGGNTYRRLSWTVGPSAPEVTAVPI